MITTSIFDELLRTWPVARLSTVHRGAPHVVPIVFCRDGDALYSPIDGKAKRSGRLQRLDNVAANPNFSLLIDDYHADWQRLWWVRLDGEAQVYRPADSHRESLRRLLLHKYPQYAQTPLSYSTEPVFLRLTWSRVIDWVQHGTIDTQLRRALNDREQPPTPTPP